MSLKAWIDENDNLYLAGDDNGHEAKTAGVQEVLDVANKLLDEAEEYKPLFWGDLGNFRTLWVNPEAFEQEHWDNDQWADTRTAQEDGWFSDKGWVPVLTIELEAAL